MSFVQQRLLLPACDLFLTHAGFSSVQRRSPPGIPMVALPALYAEQPINAQRLTELGVGMAVDPDEADPATLAAACRRVLSDLSCRLAALGYQRRILGLPGIGRLVADLTTLAS